METAPVDPLPIFATTIPPFLRFAQMPLDDSNQSWQRRSAIAASPQRLIGILPE
jgi:hypothetical protein